MSHAFSEHQKINNTWVSFIETGNHYFENGDYPAAQLQYQQALALGTQLLQTAAQQVHAPEMIHLYIISCNNIANIHQQLNQQTEAEAVLRQAYNTALTLINRNTLPLTFRSEIYNGFHSAFQRLMEFYAQQGDRQSVDELIYQAQPIALKFLERMNLLTHKKSSNRYPPGGDSY
jgi:tetratricopeptide (TPR) repeat protein